MNNNNEIENYKNIRRIPCYQVHRLKINQIRTIFNINFQPDSLLAGATAENKLIKDDLLVGCPLVTDQTQNVNAFCKG